jgi:superfamily II DNA or RNA helicase
MELRYYQSDLLNSVSEQWAKGLRNVLMMAPTGAGKTLPLAEAIRRHAGTSCAIAHRDNLVIQLAIPLRSPGGPTPDHCEPKDPTGRCGTTGQEARAYLD